MVELDDALSKLYYAAGDPGSYGGVERLYKRAVETGVKGVSRGAVRRFLTDQHSYSLHKPARKHFARNKIYVSGIDKQWQADLADMQAISRDNGGMRYLLTCIDVFSKYAWVIPVKAKTSAEMVVAFRRLLDTAAPRKPVKLQTDKGTEFLNKPLQEFLKSRDVQHFSSFSDQKAAVVERFNRTLKTRIWTYFTAHQTRRYVDILDDVVKAYNHSFHRSIGMRPADVQKKDEPAILHRLYGKDAARSKTAVVAPGHMVRISNVKGLFEKGYMPNWSEEHFLVSGKNDQPKRVYKITDKGGEEVHGSWYREELQPIVKNKYLIEKVLRRRNKEAFVKWKGWPRKFNTWIPEDDIENVR